MVLGRPEWLIPESLVGDYIVGFAECSGAWFYGILGVLGCARLWRIREGAEVKTCLEDTIKRRLRRRRRATAEDEVKTAFWWICARAALLALERCQNPGID